MIFNANEHPESVPAWLQEDARERETKQLIEEAATKAAERLADQLKKAGMIKRRQMTAIQKTEELLKLYPALKRSPAIPETITADFLKITEAALHDLETDPYFDVITRYYFDGQSREFIAQARGASVTTITRNKARLLKELAPRLFSDDVIKDLLEA